MPNSGKNTNSLKGYTQNIVKEANDFVRKYKQTAEMSNTPGPGTDKRANELRGQQNRAAGQVVGSLFGKKYDAKGRRTN
jgi:hypothetical protein